MVTSRVVGFQAVREELTSKYDHLVVGPLDHSAKQAFVERWTKLIGWDAARTANLVHQVCHGRATTKLTDNIFLLALMVQIQALDQELPGRRVDIYRRAVQLMIQRRRPFPGPELSLNEVVPHLEFLAYQMRKKGVQRCSDTEAVKAFHTLRQLEPGEVALQARSPEDLLRSCIDSLSLLNIAGTEIDNRGFERLIIQFFHQSFQEYFAGQAIKHGHDATGQQGAVARLRDLLANIEILEREVNIWGEYKIVEPVLADYWQEAVRMAIADLAPVEADDAVLMLLPGPTTPSREARSRAVFALQCLADEPPVSERAVSAVFDAVIDNLEENDGFNTELHTWMDEALAAAARSVFGHRLRNRLLDGFIHSRGDQRYTIGACLNLRLSNSDLDSENADSVIAAVSQGLSSSRQVERVRAALDLLERCYRKLGKLGFLTSKQQRDLQDILLSALSKDEATEGAAAWALCWLTGGRHRSKPDNPHDFVYLDSSKIRIIEATLRNPDLDSRTLSFRCPILTRERNIRPVFQQLDWIYQLALIADGDKTRRDLPAPKPTGGSASIPLLIDLLKKGFPAKHSCWIAQALGAFGAYIPEMIAPLRFLLFNHARANDDRDEAAIYLGLIGTSEATSVLVEAADTPPDGNDDYLYSRGLFGLLLLDDVDVLAEQMLKALPHSDLSAYAYGLAGSPDPRGRALLQNLTMHPNARIRGAATKGLDRFKMLPLSARLRSLIN